MPIQVYYRWPPMPKPWVRFIKPASAAKTLHIIKNKTHSSCEIEHFKVVFCRVLTKRTEGIYPGIILQRSYVKSVGHSYPYPELLEVLYDIPTHTRNFWKFYTPVPTILETSGSSVRTPCPYPELL